MKKITKAFLIITVMVCAAALVSCSADRNNKWDPGADNYVGSKDDGGDIVRNWQQAEILSTSTECFYPDVAIDKNSGNAIVVWADQDPAQDAIVALNYYRDNNKGWDQGAARIDDQDNTNHDSCSMPRVAMNDSGAAIAVWSEYSHPDTSYVLRSREYDSSSKTWAGTWEAIASMYPDSVNIDIDNYGNAGAVWEQTTNAHGSIYDAGSDSWSAYMSLSAGSAYNTAISVHPEEGYEEAYAVWDDSYDVSFNYYNYGWGSESGIAPSQWTGTEECQYPDVKFCTNYDVYVVFSITSNMTYHQGVWYLRNSAGWDGSPSLVSDNNDQDTQNPKLAMTDDGSRAVVVWQQYDAGYYHIYARRIFPNLGNIYRIDTIGEECDVPSVDINNNGQAVAAWRQGNGVEAAVYDEASDTWTPSTAVNSGGDWHGDVKAVIDNNGNAIVVWNQNVNTNDDEVWAARYQ